MKFRKTFVANSSTSSYVCAACGGIESYDDNTCGFDDVGLCECINSHVVHEDCADLAFLTNTEKLRPEVIRLLERAIKDCQERIEEYGDKKDYLGYYPSDKMKRHQEILDNLDEHDIPTLYKSYSDWRFALPEFACPVCSFTSLNDNYLFQYYLRSTMVSRDYVLNMIKINFKDFAEFKEFIESEPDLYDESHH